MLADFAIAPTDKAAAARQIVAVMTKGRSLQDLSISELEHVEALLQDAKDAVTEVFRMALNQIGGTIAQRDAAR